MPEPPVNAELREAVSLVAPGTGLRESIDMIIAAKTGALICIGDVKSVNALSNDGFTINAPFTAQKLFELSKMDGAILLDDKVETILSANLHLMPDPSLTSNETGTRHRTAELISKQTNTLVISISQRRDIVSLYRNGDRLFIESTEILLSKANQALQTLDNYRTKFYEGLDRLTMLEFNDAVTLSSLTYILSRYEMFHRVQLEIERYVEQLGTAGRLVRMQLDELTARVEKTVLLLIMDYAADDSKENAKEILGNLSQIEDFDDLYSSDVIAHELDLEGLDHDDDHVSSRGYRVMSRVPMLPNSAMSRIIDTFGSLPAIAKASPEKLDTISGITSKRARAILHSLENMRGGN